MKMKRYWAPTPKKWRKIGDAMLAMALYGEVHSQTVNHTVGAFLTYGGLIGKFITNFFSDDEPVTPS